VTSPLHLLRLPLTDYDAARRWQRAVRDAVWNGGEEYLALLQHPPVYTFGRRLRPEHLLLDSEVLAALGARLVETDRGGDVTFHGPGQIVGYPVLDLRRHGLMAVDYVRLLEQTMLDALAGFGVAAERSAGRPGVWAGPAKIGAVGVRIQGGVATHGFALNVDPDLSWFEAIVPCGLAGVSVTSIKAILGSAPSLEVVQDALADAFAALFGFEITTDQATISEPAAAAGELVTHGR
jgi:lipoyl(octanoyl) transferase